MSLHDLDGVVKMFKDGAIPELGDGVFSYVGLLLKQLHLRKPKRILEWGTRLSTVIMAINAPQAEIISIESDVAWFMFWMKHLHEYKHVKVYPLKIEGNYVEAPLAMGKFDLIFVDGVDGTDDAGTGSTRPPCLEVATKILNPGGVVLLHDAEREWFQSPIQKYYVVVDESEGQWNSHTVALELKK